MVLSALAIRRFAVCMLLATYGLAGVLGDGLHALWHTHHDPNAPPGAQVTSSCSHHHHPPAGHPPAGHSAAGHSAAGHSAAGQMPVEQADDSTDVLAKLENHQRQTRQHSHPHACAHHHAPASKSQSPDSQTVTAVITDGPCVICMLLSQLQSTAVATSNHWYVQDVTTQQPADETLQPLCFPSEHPARGPPAC
jgi:hypothetical protein